MPDLTHELQTLREENQRLRREAHLYRAIIDGIPAGIMAKDRQGRYLMINAFAAQSIGQAPEAIMGRTDAELLSAAAAAAADQREQQVFSSGKPVEVEITMSMSFTDDTYTLLATNFPIYDEQGQFSAVGGIGVDITDRKRMEEDLRTFKALIDHAPSLISVAGIDGQFRYMNPAFRTRFGIAADTPPHAIGIADIAAPEHESENVQYTMAQILKQGAWTGRRTMRTSDGSTFLSELTVFVLYNNQGQPDQFVSIAHDISDQVEAETERIALQQQVIDAQRAALRELSTPLIPIADDVVIMPLIGTIDGGRSQMVMETLLEGVAHYQAELAILDITGVSIVDTQVAQALMRAAMAVKLLGARVMLTGIQPQIAQTLVHLGVDLTDITTCGSLQDGIAEAMQRYR